MQTNQTVGVPLRELINSRLALMDLLRIFVGALNGACNVKRLKVCCSFLNEPQRRVSSEISLQGLLFQFHALRKDIELDVQFMVYGDWEEVSHEWGSDSRRRILELPVNGFPSAAHNEYLALLRTGRQNTSTKPVPCLMDEWIVLRAWLLSNITRRTSSEIDVARFGPLIERLQTHFFAQRPHDLDMLNAYVMEVW
jgi:hypothetical protein